MWRKIINSNLLLIILDIILINASFVGAFLLRLQVPLAPEAEPLFYTPDYVLFLIFATFLFLSVFWLLGFYERRGISSVLDEMLTTFGAISLGMIILFSSLFLIRGFWFSRQILLSAWILLSFSAIAVHILVRGIRNRLQRKWQKQESPEKLAEKILSKEEIMLSIIIVSYNVKDLLDKCLASIFANTYRPFEIHVVDNASKDGTVTMISQNYPQVKIIANRENKGFAAANNQAIRVSKGEYILLLNPDTFILPGAIDVMVAYMDNHSNLGALGCQILNPDGTIQPSVGSFPVLWNFVNQLLFGRERGKYSLRGYNVSREVDWCTGAALMLRRKALDEVGLLDEGFFMFYEDVDLCYRLKEHGWKTYFTPEAKLIHYGGQSQKIVINRMFPENMKSYYRFYTKHYSKISQGLLRGIIFLYNALKSPFSIKLEERKDS